mgnify:CR=1 FL=1
MIPKIHLFFARETFFCCVLTQAFSSRLPRFKDHNSIKRQSLVQKGSVSFVIFPLCNKNESKRKWDSGSKRRMNFSKKRRFKTAAKFSYLAASLMSFWWKTLDDESLHFSVASAAKLVIAYTFSRLATAFGWCISSLFSHHINLANNIFPRTIFYNVLLSHSRFTDLYFFCC